MPDLTTKELSLRTKKLDTEIVHCLDNFLRDTDVAVIGMDIHLNDCYEYDIQYHFAFADE